MTVMDIKNVNICLIINFCWFKPITYGLGAKCPLGGQNIKFSYISTIMTIKCPTIGKCWELIGTITLQNLLQTMQFVKIVLLGANGAKISVEQQKRLSRGSKIRKSTIFQQLWLCKD